MRRHPLRVLSVGGLILFAIVAFALHRAKSQSEREPSPVPTILIVATLRPTGIPSPTVSPHPIPTATPIHLRLYARSSSYWPPAGGHNCAYFVGGQCLSRMASLEPWQLWIDKAVSCPAEWPFGTLVIFDGRTWVCLDRGGRIKYVKGIPWIDFLTRNPVANYGAIISVEIAFPLNSGQPFPTDNPTCDPPDCRGFDLP